MMFALTVVIIIFCELAPKIYAAVHSEPVALSAASFTDIAVVTSRAVVHQSRRLPFLRLFGVRAATHGAQRSARELRAVVSNPAP